MSAVTVTGARGRRGADGERIGLVLAGGGARGAYEAGALSMLVPALAERGQRPSVFVGTSVGAINAAYLAASRHVNAEEAAAGGLGRWREVTKARVVRPLLSQQLPLAALRYVGEVLSVPGLRLPSLLDPAPLQRNLPRWIDWPALHANVGEGVVDAVAVVATAARSGRTVVFVERAARGGLHHSHVVEYVPTRLGDEHLRASAAIPILFPPVRVETPPEARGWYFDGGTRLNTPIKPALDLGVDRIVVVGTDAVATPSDESGRHDCEAPDFGDGALHVLQGALVDPLVEDMRMLGNVNVFYGDPETAPAATSYRRARGKRPYRQIPYIFVAPGEPGAIGALAAEVFRSRYGGLKGLRSPDFPLLNRLLGGESPTHGELLSYLFFDQDFIAELIRMGRQDAGRWLEEPHEGDGPWQVEPLRSFVSGEQSLPAQPS